MLVLHILHDLQDGFNLTSEEVTAIRWNSGQPGRREGGKLGIATFVLKYPDNLSKKFDKDAGILSFVGVVSKLIYKFTLWAKSKQDRTNTDPWNDLFNQLMAST